MLHMLEPKKKSFLPYSEASQLPTTDERDLPSHTATAASVAKTELRKKQLAADKAKKDACGGVRIFQTSKVRTIIFCDNPACQKPRLIYAINKNKNMLPSMDAYAEEISYAVPAPATL